MRWKVASPPRTSLPPFFTRLSPCVSFQAWGRPVGFSWCAVNSSFLPRASSLLILAHGADHVEPAIVHGIKLAAQDRLAAGERVVQGDVSPRPAGKRLGHEQRLGQK